MSGLSARGPLLGVLVALALAPIAWAALASLGIVPDNGGSPPTLHGALSLGEYTETIGVAEPHFARELAQSLTVALFATLVVTFCAFVGAYGLARARRRGARLLVPSMLVLGSLPVVAYVIPLADTMRRLGLPDTLVGVGLAQAAGAAPLAVYVLHGYLSDIPIELEDAARIDGARLPAIIARIVLPVTAPAVVATAVVIFVLQWNAFLVPLVLGSENVRTIPVAMSDFFTFERELQWQTAAAALMSSLVPLVVLIVAASAVLQRFRLAEVDPG
jgi:ABC-type glycerol-3-phosphate transport system permease component